MKDEIDRMLERDKQRQNARRRNNEQREFRCICGETDPIVMENDHIAGRAYSDVTYGLCFNCHRRRTTRQQSEHPPEDGDPRNPFAAAARTLMGVIDYLEFIVEHLRKIVDLQMSGTENRTAADPDQQHENASDPIDTLIIQLRSYVPEKDARRQENGRRDPKPSDWVLVFDTETTTDVSQRLRFGAYQLRNAGRIVEAGFFTSSDTTALSAADRQVLETYVRDIGAPETGAELRLVGRSEFTERFFQCIDAGGTIVGFNLPFDLSRFATAHSPARDRMRGGFSFKLSSVSSRGNVRVKHLSACSQFIDIAGAEAKDGRKAKSEGYIPVNRGFFVDVRTLAAAMTSASHSLESLSSLLNIPHPKQARKDHGKELTREYVRYAMADVQATWECFVKLKRRLDSFGLDIAGPHQIYSEASIGKAFLKTMGIKPWREMQPDYSPSRIGHILSAFFAGRAEVYIRREITPVIHCDFLSMYPTVCTLMNLWRFVIAQGIDEHDCTEDVRAFVETLSIADLQDP
eukprot:gene19566-20009_t